MEAPEQMWKISGLEPSYGLNRNIMPVSIADIPTFTMYPERYPQRLGKITQPERTFLFHDGN